MFLTINNNGDVISITNTQMDDADIYLEDEDAIAALLMADLNNVKWVNGELITTSKPSPYHNWQQTQWVLNQTLLKEARDAVWEDLKIYREQRQYLGARVTLQTTQVSYWIHTDQPSRALHLGLAISALFHILHTYVGISLLPAFPANQRWKTMEKDSNGEPIFIDLDFITALLLFAMDVYLTSQCFAVAEMHRVALYQSSDPLNYNYKTNWPLVFGE